MRFSDVDVYGHVNNVKYFEYFQEARIPLLERLGRSLPGAGDYHVVVAQTDVDYKVPILFRLEPYDVHSRITHVGSSRSPSRRRSATARPCCPGRGS